MKQAILKKKTVGQPLKDHPDSLPVQTSQSSADQPEGVLLEDSPWLVEIQNALSPYWSARLTR